MIASPLSLSIRPIHVFVALVLALSVLTASFPGDAQTDKIDSIREQRRQVEASAKEKAKEINVADAELEQVSATLAALTSSVNAQEARVTDAQRQLAEAEISLADSEAAVLQGEADIESLKQLLADRAISSFVTQGSKPVLLAQTDDPNLAVRMQHLVDGITRADVDVADALRAAEEDLALDRQNAEELRLDAIAIGEQMAADLGALEEDQALQAKVTAEAEERLNSILAERAALEAQGFQLDKQLTDAQDQYAAELARRQAAKPAAAPKGSGSSGGSAGPVASSDEIVNAGGIWVHESISANVSSLLSDAAAAGVSFGGGGYRDPSGQIRVRQSNCGTSDYAVYQMPSSQCRPPTAKPGSSMHERGLAIDFTFNGRIISSRSGDGWNWLANNAASYGLYNLPSEPWHWSTNGG